MAQSIYKNALFKGILSFFNIVIPLLVIPYVYRVLDPVAIGYIEYGNSLYTYFYIFGSLGIYGYGLREISKARSNPHVVKKIYRNLFGIGLISNLLAFLVFLFFALFGVNNDSLKTVLLIFSISVIANALYTEWINEAFEDFIFITAKTIIIRTASVFSIFIFVREKNDIFVYVFITVFVILLNNIVSFIYAHKYTHYKLNLNNLDWKGYLPPLFFIFVLNNSNVLYTTLDKTMLGAYSGVEAVAFYSVGQKIMEIIRALLLTGIFVTIPRLSFYLANDFKKYISGLQRITRITLFLVIPVSIGLILLSKEVVVVFAGNQYLLAIIPMQIFAFRILVLSIESLAAQQVMFLNGKEKIILGFNIVFGLLNLSLNFLLINSLTPEIAIAKTLIVEILLVLCELFYIRRYLKIDLKIFSKSVLLYFLLSLLFIPIVFTLRLSINSNIGILIASFIACGFFYILGNYLLKEPLILDVKVYALNRLKKPNK